MSAHPRESEPADPFPHLAPGTFARLHRSRMVEVGAGLSAAATATFGVFYWFGGTPLFFGINFLGAAAFLLVAAARSLAVERRLYIAVTIGLLLFGVQLACVADINNGITPWLLVPPIAAVIIGDRRLATYSTAVAFLEPGLVVAAVLVGLLRPLASLPYPNLLMLLSILGVVGICGSFAYVSNGTRARLQAEVDRRAAALAEALAEAERAKRAAIEAAEAKDAFFANLTHEIRTPLTGIAGSAELLVATDDPREQRHLADALLASTRSLTALVNAMLDHARLAAGHATIDMGPVAPREVAFAIASLYRLSAHERGLAFDVAVANSVPASLVIDGIRLQQVLANLVANALKFTDAGEVRLEVDWEPGADPGAGTLVAAVSDTGPGIASDRLDAVFEPFVQGDASIRRTHGGTGLGLAISRQLAELLGGSLEVSSELGAGSTFTVRVPAADVSSIAGAELAVPSPVSGARVSPAQATARAFRLAHTGDRAIPQPEAALAGLRIMLVEDNDINRNIAATILRRSGAEVIPAPGGREAIELLDTMNVDLILMDLQMPGIDGIETTRRIREAEAAVHRLRLPIVAMTGNAIEDYGDACDAAGMDGFLTKPVTAARLCDVVQRTLARA